MTSFFSTNNMLANLLRKKGVPAALGVFTFIFLATLGYQSSQPPTKLDADDAEIASYSYPSPSKIYQKLPDLSKTLQNLNSVLKSDKTIEEEASKIITDNNNIEIEKENEGVVVKRKNDDKRSSEGNPCIMKRKSPVQNTQEKNVKIAWNYMTSCNIFVLCRISVLKVISTRVFYLKHGC